MSMERGGTSKPVARGSAPRSKRAQRAQKRFLITLMAGLNIARPSAIARNAHAVAKRFTPKHRVKSIVQTLASVAPNTAKTAENISHRAKNLWVVFAAKSAITSSFARLDQSAMVAAATRSSKSPKARQGQSESTDRAVISGCLSTGGLCSKHWGAHWRKTRTFTTSTDVAATIDQRIWSFGNDLNRLASVLRITIAPGASVLHCQGNKP